MTFLEARQQAELWPNVWGIDLEQELNKMDYWVAANPRRVKRNWKRFIVNWLNKAQANQAEGLRNALVGKFNPSRPVTDYSEECERILAKFPDLRNVP